MTDCPGKENGSLGGEISPSATDLNEAGEQPPGKNPTLAFA